MVTVTQASFISQDTPGSTHGSAMTISVDPANPLTKGLLQTPIFTSEGGTIPDGSTITSATLDLVVTTGSSSNNVMDLHRVITPWAEDTVTWNSFNSGGVAGTDYDATAEDGQVPSGGTTTFNVTSLVQEWSNGTANRGVIIISRNVPTAGDGVLWDSDDTTTASNRPVFNINYTAVPEPSQFLLMGLVAGVVVSFKVWKKRRQA